MQARNDGVYPYMSYITADGDEVILSSESISKYFEFGGRTGFDAPSVQPVNRKYADGSTETLAIQMEPRSLGVTLVVVGKNAIERDAIIRDMASRLIQLGSRKEWGKLKCRRRDGKYVVIDCVYVGGLDGIQRRIPRLEAVTLEFQSGNGYFYDAEENVLTTETLVTLVYLSDDLYLSDSFYLSDGITDIHIDNDGELFYPVVDVFGPASVIRMTNSATGETLALNEDFSLLANQRLTIDCREHSRKITLLDADGTVTDVTEQLGLGSSLIWAMKKGENVISVYYADSNEDSFVRVRYQRRYLSL